MQMKILGQGSLEILVWKVTNFVILNFVNKIILLVIDTKFYLNLKTNFSLDLFNFG